MAGKIYDKTKNMLSSIGAMQTLVENFPMSLISFGDLNFAASFDVLSILFKMLGTDRQEIIDLVTDWLCGGNIKEDSEGTGVIAQIEEVVKVALEANIINILNCSTNPVISNNLLDSYMDLNTEKIGEGIEFNLSEIDFTGVLNKNPFNEKEKYAYFDVNENDYTPNTIYKSKDFNAFLWYIINKSDKSQTTERTWDNRYRAKIWGEGNGKHKEIVKLTYVDEDYPDTDKIRVHLCGSNYFKTRKVKVGKFEQFYNRTIFEFNHEFLTSIKLFDAKVIISEIVNGLLGEGNSTVNIGFSINEEIIQGKIQQIIKNVISADDTEINDCFFSFSNDEYNEMLEKSEQNRYNMININGEFIETNPTEILSSLSEITTTSTLHDDKTIIQNTITDITASPAQDPSATISGNIQYDWQFELLRMLAYPFVRPLFSPKVIFLLLVNKKIMGSIEDVDFNKINLDTFVEEILNGIFVIIKDIIIQLKNMLIEMLMKYVLEKLRPLIELMASRLLLETLQMYKDLLVNLIDACAFGWNNNPLIGNIDNVNYADIIPTQTEPNQSIC